MLAQHFQHPAVVGEAAVDFEQRTDVATVLDFEDVVEPVRCQLIRTEDPEVLLSLVLHEDIAQQFAEWSSVLFPRYSMAVERHGIVGEIGYYEVDQHTATVRDRVRAHPAVAGRRQCGELWQQRA